MWSSLQGNLAAAIRHPHLKAQNDDSGKAISFGPHGHYPLEGHSLGYFGAVASERTQTDEQFWRLVNLLYGEPTLDEGRLGRALAAQGLPVDFNLDHLLSLRGDPAVHRVQADIRLAHKLGLGATPSIVVLRAGRPTEVVGFRPALRLIQSSP